MPRSGASERDLPETWKTGQGPRWFDAAGEAAAGGVRAEFPYGMICGSAWAAAIRSKAAPVVRGAAQTCDLCSVSANHMTM
jgi:hypothetical protein